MKFLSLCVAAICTVTSAHAANWQVDPKASTLCFVGTQSGASFTGCFVKYVAHISYDAAHPDLASIDLTIDTGSAASGDVQRDTALPQADWFDILHFPNAKFAASGFQPKGAGNFVTSGTLTIRDQTKPLTLPFHLEIAGNAAHATGSVALARTDFGVGQGEWKSAEWVAIPVAVNFDFVATTAP